MIAAKGISHAFDGVDVLHDVSVEARRGAMTALIGPNAAGKSTLLRCLAGALKPSRGAALLEGVEVRSLPTQRRARRLAFVPQKPTLAADFTVREVVELGRYALEASASRVRDAIDRLELGPLADRSYHVLSAGQQQRVVIARALAQVDREGALLLDEPMAAMDVRHVLDLFRVLRGMALAGATIVMSLHDLSMAAMHADHVWLLEGGRVEGNGAAGGVMTPERLKRVFGARFGWVSVSGGTQRLVVDEG